MCCICVHHPSSHTVCHWLEVWHYETAGVVTVTLCECVCGAASLFCCSGLPATNKVRWRPVSHCGFPWLALLRLYLSVRTTARTSSVSPSPLESICPWMANAHLTLPLLKSQANQASPSRHRDRRERRREAKNKTSEKWMGASKGRGNGMRRGHGVLARVLALWGSIPFPDACLRLSSSQQERRHTHGRVFSNSGPLQQGPVSL